MVKQIDIIILILFFLSLTTNALRLRNDTAAGPAADPNVGLEESSDADLAAYSQQVEELTSPQAMHEKKFSNGIDQFSFANIDQIRTQNIELNFDVDFASKVLSGYVEHNFRALKETDRVVLDYQDIHVTKIEMLETVVKQNMKEEAEDGRKLSNKISTANLVQIDDYDQPELNYIQLSSSSSGKLSKHHRHHHHHKKHGHGHKHHTHHHHHLHSESEPNKNQTNVLFQVQISTTGNQIQNITAKNMQNPQKKEQRSSKMMGNGTEAKVYGINQTESKESKNKMENTKLPVQQARKPEVQMKVTNLNFTSETPNSMIGKALVINLPQKIKADQQFNIKIYYNTQPDSNAFSWLTPEQTLGKKLPYLFTQCQAIACRSLAPMQDTPAVKATYSATVRVPKEFTVKMSANDTSLIQLNSTHSEYKFENSIPIPSYLIALAVGDLKRVSLGKRVGVIAEPAQIESATKELEGLENYLNEVEKYVGIPYAWGQYNMLVLPPAFPFGGMENPLLTFVSPTMITGDKSQVATAIHEVAHSWTGNLVTCQTWEDFWLNESLTVFIQRKITEKLYGKERANNEALIESFNLQTSMDNIKEEKVGLTKLSMDPYDMKGSTPDIAKSAVAYEKGFQLLHHLESLVGEQSFQKFMKTFISKYAQKSVNSKDFTNTFDEFLKVEKKPIQNLIQWKKWIYSPGKFPVEFDFSSSQTNQSQSFAEIYIQLDGKKSPRDIDKLKDFSEASKLIFLDKLRENKEFITKEILARIDADFNFTMSNDPKIKQRWFWLGLSLDYEPVFEQAHKFISQQGKTENLQFIYQALADSNQKFEAEKWLQENRKFYHHAAITKVEIILASTMQEEG